MKINLKKKEKNSSDDGTMSVSGHLKELRNRIIVCLVCLAVSFLVCLHFSSDFVNLLTQIGKQYGYNFVYISPQELLLQYISVSLVMSVVVTFPVIIYQIWAFIQPGLKDNENSLLVATLISGLIFFVLGVLFAYKIMLPFMLRFLIELSRGSDVRASVSVAQYITFLMTIFLVLGLVFELPIVAVILTELGLIKTSWMKKGRRVVIVLIFFIAAVITPPDIVSQVMVAVPMIGLYELSIVICSVLEKRKRRKKDDEDL